MITQHLAQLVASDDQPEQPHPIEGLDPRDASTWPELLTPEEVAVVLRLSLGGVRRMLQRGYLPGWKTGKLWFIPKAQLLGQLNPPDSDDQD